MTEIAPIRIAALYEFTRIDPAAVKPLLLAVCRDNDIRGTMLLADEGINGTIAGSDPGVEAVLDHIRALPGCAALEIKESRAAELPFHRMKVRLKREIVTMGQPDLDPVGDVGTYVAPEDWNDLIADPDTIVIDTRNDYEVQIGTFAGSLDPKTASFGEFPGWFRQQRAAFEAEGRTPKIAMFCTGGIRCEKATAFVRKEGIDDVFHLKGGILSYLEKVSAKDSRWQGECFVFDERVSVTQGLATGTHELCRACRHPLSTADRRADTFEDGVSCPYCYHERTDEQRLRYAERQRQTKLAEGRGDDHIGMNSPVAVAERQDPKHEQGDG